MQDLPVEDTVQMFVRSASGVMGSIDLSWSVNKELPYYLSVYGSSGTMHVGWKESKYPPGRRRRLDRVRHGYDKVQAFGSQLDNFVAADPRRGAAR